MENKGVYSKQFRNQIVSLFNSKTIDDRKKSEMLVPKVLLDEKKSDVRVESVKMTTSVDENGLKHRYSVIWMEGAKDSSESFKEEKREQSEKKIKDARKTGKIECDGPCGKYVDMAHVVQFGCDHLICDDCRRSQKSEALYDGAPGCSHPYCVSMARYSGAKLQPGRKINSASSVSLRSNGGPWEVLQVFVSIVRRKNNHVYRTQLEYEFPTHTRLAELNGPLSAYKEHIATGRVYYSVRKPKTSDDLHRISLVDTNLRFYNLPGYQPLTSGKLFILIVAEGVRLSSN